MLRPIEWMKKMEIRIAGIINLIVALIHLIAGQTTLVNPLLESNLEVQQKGEWIGVWHLVTVLLFFTSYQILKAGFTHQNNQIIRQLKPLGLLYILSGIPFIVASFYLKTFAPQWILLMPIGGLLLLGIRKLPE